MAAYNGTFFTFGFFALGGGNRRPVQKPVSPSKKLHPPAPASSPPSTWFNFYSTTIQCSDNTSAPPAEIRIYSPPGDIPHPDNTIAFIVAKVHTPDTGPILLDAICMYPIPGNPLSADYEDRAPDMLHPYVYGLGTTQGKAENLADGKSKGFSVQVVERVRDQQETSSVFCVLDGLSPRWVNVPPPSPNTLISFLGLCSAVRADRKLTLALEMVVYNPSPAPPSARVPPSPQPTTPTPSGKRRKFIAFHQPVTPVAGPSDTTRSSIVEPASSQASAIDRPADDVFGSDLSPMSSRGDTVDAVEKPEDLVVEKEICVQKRAAKGKRKAE
ncbi:hypothetical protein LXA43DRAFT_1054572 [Ganoderma leucocontextum]|nr:hypothetical protein LXA43DRAFT_1054572 [Ganoderma leucocontextum]